MRHTPEDTLFSKPSAITPPASGAERMAWLRLARSRRVGPATFLRLLGEHGSAEAALAALPGIAKASGVKDYTPTSEDDAKREAAAARTLGARLLCLGEAGYPASLASIADPPPCLWALGKTDLAARPGIAIVGARNASALGLRMTETLARETSAFGYAITSGLARGIDTEAHKAALEGGTIAVLAGGLDCPYPRENEGLMREIAEQGLLLSEARMGLQPQARHFPPRNRIVSGLSQAVVVVEAAARSGTLITARNALDQGREVLAVPGHPFDARASGCNLLIRDGATLIRSGEDIAAALGQSAPARPVPGHTKATPKTVQKLEAKQVAPPPTAPANLPHTLLNLLGTAPISEDALIRQLGLPASPVLEALVDLDLEGHIARHPGGLVSRAVA